MANYLDNDSNTDYINENSSSSLFFDTTTDDLGVPLLIKVSIFRVFFFASFFRIQSNICLKLFCIYIR